jgi:hypothetical protein
VVDDEFVADWKWLGPDWDDINDPDSSAVGWVSGDALSEEAQADLDDFIDGLGSGDINLYVGPLNWQDATEFLADGVEATDADLVRRAVAKASLGERSPISSASSGPGGSTPDDTSHP